MKQIKILSEFTAYPGGTKTTFIVGATPSLNDEDADLYVAKGLAEPIKEPAPKAKKDEA